MQVIEVKKDLPIKSVKTKEGFNPRKDLGEIDDLVTNVKEHGVIQNLVIAVIKGTNSEFLVCGHRRLEASKKAGLTTVPVTYVSVESETEALCIALSENSGDVRTDLNCVDRAKSYDRIQKELKADGGKGTPQKIADMVGTSRSSVARHLSLLELEPEALKMAEEGSMSLRAALALVSQPEHDREDTLEAIKKSSEESDKKGLKAKPITSRNVNDKTSLLDIAKPKPIRNKAKEAEESEPEVSDGNVKAPERVYKGFLAGSVQSKRDLKRTDESIRDQFERIGLQVLEKREEIEEMKEEQGEDWEIPTEKIEALHRAEGMAMLISWYFGGPDFDSDGSDNVETQGHFEQALVDLDQELVRRYEASQK